MAQTGVSTWSSFIPAKQITCKLHLPGALTDSRDQPNFLYHKKIIVCIMVCIMACICLFLIVYDCSVHVGVSCIQ